MSRIGVPSMASRPCTVSSRPATSSKAQTDTPRWLGRTGECPARTPTCGHAGLPRGWVAPRRTLVSWWKWKTTSMWVNSLSPSVAAGSRTAGSKTSRDTTAPQWSSTIWDRPPRTIPIGVSTMGSVTPAGLRSGPCSGEQVADRGGEDADRVVLVDVAGPDLVVAGVHQCDGRRHQPPGGQVGAEGSVCLPALKQRTDDVVRGLVGPC